MAPVVCHEIVEKISLLLVQVSGKCDRGLSRIARQIFAKSFQSVITSHGYTAPAKCPLSRERDLYAVQEENKYFEPHNRWYCQFCGKGFYDEQYLDLHFENRHSDTLVQDNVTCIADYCDIARCEIVSGRYKPNFWDIAMCRNKDMSLLHEKCIMLMKQCLPENINNEVTLLDLLKSSVCASLNCDSYWDVPVEEDTIGPVLIYTFLSIIIFSSILVYYCAVCNYFVSIEEIREEQLLRAQLTPDPIHHQSQFRFSTTSPTQRLPHY